MRPFWIPFTINIFYEMSDATYSIWTKGLNCEESVQHSKIDTISANTHYLIDVSITYYTFSLITLSNASLNSAKLLIMVIHLFSISTSKPTTQDVSVSLF